MRRGFTLVEVLVALVLAGLGLSVAGGVFGAASDTLTRLERESRRWARVANARTWLDETLMSAEGDAGAGVTFEGDGRGLRFRGWQWTRDGWVEPASVEITFAADGLRATTSSGLDMLLLEAEAGGAIQYLPRLGADAEWQATWSSDDRLPVAVRIVARRASPPASGDADTLLVLVGSGG